jgi:hypothetical protein
MANEDHTSHTLHQNSPKNFRMKYLGERQMSFYREFIEP